MRLTDKVVALIKDDEHFSAYRIAKDTGIAQANISNLRNGKRKIGNIALETAEKLGKYWEEEIMKVQEAEMREALGLISEINERQTNSNDDLYQIQEIMNYKELEKFDGSQLDDDDHSIVEVEYENAIDEDSQFILIVSTPDFEGDEDDGYRQIYHATDLAKDDAYSSLKQDITSNAHSDLLNLTNIFNEDEDAD